MALLVGRQAFDLGQRGGDALNIAGYANLLLSSTLRAQFVRVVGPDGTTVEWEGWPGYVVATTTTSTTTTSTTSTTTTSTTTTTIP